jgi:predicted metal-binding membrane protein
MAANAGLEISQRIACDRRAAQLFFGASALIFVASAAITIVWCSEMSATMPMPGGWTMSMSWMRMPGETLLSSAVSFLGMWVVMMMAMMLPSMVPTLWRYRQTVGGSRAGSLTLLVAFGYFFVWIVIGIAAFPLGVATAEITMKDAALARAVPIAVGIVVLFSGALQVSTWKMHHLDHCRKERDLILTPNAIAAWRSGLRLGFHCSFCCASFVAILMVIGVMDLRVMAVVTAAITIERLAPRGHLVARVIGAIIISGGLFLIAQALGLG